MVGGRESRTIGRERGQQDSPQLLTRGDRSAAPSSCLSPKQERKLAPLMISRLVEWSNPKRNPGDDQCRAR